MGKRRSPRGSVRSSRQQNSGATGPEISLTSSVAWGLLLARWLVPTEGGAQGETLWLTTLTLFAAALICWARSRDTVLDSDAQATSGPRRFTPLDWSALLFCGGHILAALLVVLTEGNRRTALNLGWEWTSLTVLYLLLRDSLHDSLTGLVRPTFLRTVIALWVALAGYGIWQHVIWYPATVKNYEQARSRYDDALRDAANGSAAAQRRLNAAAGELTKLGVPLSGSSRELFERRLRDSQEPLGFFALANSFAGCLAVVVVLLTVLLVQTLTSTIAATPETRAGPQQTDRRATLIRLAVILLPLLLTAACLILTKSRTAWCGALAGLSLAGLLGCLKYRSSVALRRGIISAAGLVVVIGGLAGTAALTGGLDPNVIREAPKSLKYRLEYWSGSLAVIAERPLLGVGPGQFRDHYLRHKLPESSEEIADPHQAILDVWSNAGLPALLGLLAFTGFAARNLIRRSLFSIENEPHSPASPDDTAPSTGLAAILLGTGCVLGANLVIEAQLNWNVISVGVAAAACWFLLRPRFLGPLFASDDGTPISSTRERQSAGLQAGLSCGLGALLVHLMGAGGIAMPGVVSVAFFLALLTDCPRTRSSTPPRFSHESRWSAAALACAALSILCALTGFLPDQSRRALLAAGDFEAAQGRITPQAERFYREAATADSLSPDPWIRLSNVQFQRWSATDDLDLYDSGIKAANEALKRSPNTASIAYHSGHWCLKRAQREDNASVAQQAVEWLERAVAGYPTEPQWIADLAIAHAVAGDEEQAARSATEALRLDEQNHSAGHIDRYLDKDLKSRLVKLLDGD
ncbi:MAG: O-antigen ligase family protein [Planctomycetota bacterium]|jgi:tetratricopeptide (TPR) repeat protein